MAEGKGCSSVCSALTGGSGAGLCITQPLLHLILAPAPLGKDLSHSCGSSLAAEGH